MLGWWSISVIPYPNLPTFSLINYESTNEKAGPFPTDLLCFSVSTNSKQCSRRAVLQNKTSRPWPRWIQRWRIRKKIEWLWWEFTASLFFTVTVHLFAFCSLWLLDGKFFSARTTRNLASSSRHIFVKNKHFSNWKSLLSRVATFMILMGKVLDDFLWVMINDELCAWMFHFRIKVNWALDYQAFREIMMAVLGKNVSVRPLRPLCVWAQVLKIR